MQPHGHLTTHQDLDRRHHQAKGWHVQSAHQHRVGLQAHLQLCEEVPSRAEGQQVLAPPLRIPGPLHLRPQGQAVHLCSHLRPGRILGRTLAPDQRLQVAALLSALVRLCRPIHEMHEREVAILVQSDNLAMHDKSPGGSVDSASDASSIRSLNHLKEGWPQRLEQAWRQSEAVRGLQSPSMGHGQCAGLCQGDQASCGHLGFADLRCQLIATAFRFLRQKARALHTPEAVNADHSICLLKGWRQSPIGKPATYRGLPQHLSVCIVMLIHMKHSRLLCSSSTYSQQSEYKSKVTVKGHMQGAPSWPRP